MGRKIKAWSEVSHEDFPTTRPSPGVVEPAGATGEEVAATVGQRTGSTSPLAHPARPPRTQPLSQIAVRTPQNANAPAGRPGRSLWTVRRASFARASWS